MEAILIGAIGRCPKCFEFLQLPDEVPIELMLTPPRCMCGAIITPESQGLICINEVWQKVRWLNKFGQWVEIKPDKPFILIEVYREWLVLTDYGGSPSLDMRQSKPSPQRPKPQLVTLDGKRVKGT